MRRRPGGEKIHRTGDDADTVEEFVAFEQEERERLAGQINEEQIARRESEAETLEENLFLVFKQNTEGILEDIPTEDGKRVFEEMLDEQVDIFENILRGKIKTEDLYLRTSEILIEKGDSQFREYLKDQFSLGQTSSKKLKKAFRKLLKYRGGTIENLEDLEASEDEVASILKSRNELGDYLHERKLATEGENDGSFVEANEQAEKELISEEVRRVLAKRELATHHVAHIDPQGKAWSMGDYSDIDGSGAIRLLKLAKIDVSKGKYVPPGQLERGAVNFDTGNKDGLVVEYGEVEMEERIADLTRRVQILEDEIPEIPEGEEKKEKEKRLKRAEEEIEKLVAVANKERGKETVILDHHGPHSHRDTSATKVTYEVLKKFGLLELEEEEERNYEKLVDFITKLDNARYDGYTHRDFKSSDRTVLGLGKWMNFDKLFKHFNTGRDERDMLSDSELRQLGLIYKTKSRGRRQTEVNRSEYQRRNIEKAERRIKELERKGWVFSDENRAKFIVDLNGEAGTLGPWAAAAKGYDGIIRYSPDRNGFSVMFSGEYDLSKFKDLPQGIGVRGGMFFLPMDREKLIINLDDLIARIAPNFIPKKGSELDRHLSREERVIQSTITRSPSKSFWWTRSLSGEPIILEKAPPKRIKNGDEIYIKIKNPQRGKIRANRGEINKGYPEEFFMGVYEPDIAKEEN